MPAQQGETKIKNHNAKPPVTPPESHSEPSFPTLAALGILAAATTLTAGCDNCTRGAIRAPRERAAPVEKECDTEIMGLMVLPGNIPAPSETEKNVPEEVRLEGDIASPDL